MSRRWQHKAVEVAFKIFGGKNSNTERAQAELDKMSAQGWELVSVVQADSTDPIRMFFKREG